MTIKQLSRENELSAFKRATGFDRSRVRWAEYAQTGLSDKKLTGVLAFEMGIFGGMGARNQLSITYQGSGLKIWAGWHIVNHVMEKPIFEGKETIAMAREVYGIRDPSDNQLAMF
jgi:hypothetical protein